MISFTMVKKNPTCCLNLIAFSWVKPHSCGFCMSRVVLRQNWCYVLFFLSHMHNSLFKSGSSFAKCSWGR